MLILAPEAYLPLREVGARFHASMEGVAAADQAFALLAGRAGSRPPDSATGASRPCPTGRRSCGSRACADPSVARGSALDGVDLAVRRGGPWC